MSHYHHECAKAIRELLAKVPEGLTRVQIYQGIAFHGKSEKVFGPCFVAMCEAGDLVEIRLPLNFTKYTLAINAPKAPAQQRIRDAKPGVGVGHKAAILDVLTTSAKESMTLDEIASRYRVLGAAAIKGYLVVLENERKVNVAPGAGRRPAYYSLPRMAARKQSPAAEAPAAAATPDPRHSRAADLHPELQAIELKDWQELDKHLSDANARAIDARNIYIQSSTEAAVMKQLDGAIESTTTALRLHRQRRPA